MSAHSWLLDWTRRLFRRQERTPIDYDAREEFERRTREIAARLERIRLVTEVPVERHRNRDDRTCQK